MTTLSWLTLIRKADETYDKERLYPVDYEFSNGRQFRQGPNSGPYRVSTNTSTST